ncbi:MAG: Zn-ribbon domain-containing OB-fold protein [Chloroflexi bacterium]|nr:Zn-ribbon domain-containing OB-fold protein [Chloroflexota bacterium]MBM4452637.1 Zn-ribbon domain-containing OB-fold protein [Chloroflexota bacterium]MBM4453272.1 Zn-ribbon domain-containing OB-fold protein [Chloroflexota bacterium]
MSPLEKIVQTTQTKSLQGDIPVYGQYTFGVAGERFFREIKDNARIMGATCKSCNLTYVPARLFCERCFNKLEDWVDVGKRGVVHTYTLSYLDLDENRLDKPVILAMVQLDGAYGGLVHRLGEVTPEKIRIGMPVEAVFKAKAEREGSILDIKYFKPC